MTSRAGWRCWADRGQTVNLVIRHRTGVPAEEPWPCSKGKAHAIQARLMGHTSGAPNYSDPEMNLPRHRKGSAHCQQLERHGFPLSP